MSMFIPDLFIMIFIKSRIFILYLQVFYEKKTSKSLSTVMPMDVRNI